MTESQVIPTRRNGAHYLPLLEEKLQVPAHVAIEGDRLTFTFEKKKGCPAAVPSMLSEFIDLADAPVERIARYASRWGILHICEHDLPSSHMFTGSGRHGDWCPYYARATSREGWHWEPLASWRRFSREARAILRVAHSLHSGAPGRPQDWTDIVGSAEWAEMADDGEGETAPSLGETVSFDEVVLTYVVRQWLQWGWVNVEFEWSHRKSMIQMKGIWLFGALAVHLMQAVARIEALTICSACGRAYVPARKPTAGRRHYCTHCGLAAAQRAAARDYRARKSGRARDSHQTGANP